MSQLVRVTGVLGFLLVVSAPSALGANQKEIDRAIKRGADALKALYNRPAAGLGAAPANQGTYGIGGTALAGLAILEANTPANDPAVKAITEAVRNAAYTESKTYQISLCLMYLDRLGDPADVVLIQTLAVRLLVGQNPKSGGWGYQCISAVSADDAKRLRAVKANHKAGTLHPDIEKYGQALMRQRGQDNAGVVAGLGDDNSNTQFALLAVWMSRKHGVPVETSLNVIEARFMASQDARTGNWPYSGGAVGVSSGSPAMYCAGLLGMATGVARREEKKLKPDPPAPKPDAPKADTKPLDPFYNPPGSKEPAKKPGAARRLTVQDRTIQMAFAGLGLTLADQLRGGKGLLIANGTHGHGDLYFLWSMERVGVAYGVDKIGGFNWYDLGSTVIVRSQSPDGTWGIGSYGAEVNTAFAILFLSRSNLARDLSSKVQKDATNTEMRAGAGPSATDLLPNRPTLPTITPAVIPVLDLPNPTGDAGIAMAVKMLKAPDADWKKLVKTARDTKGSTNTRALVAVATSTVGDRKKQARDALAERLCRMTPATLRWMLKAEKPELRRGATLACAMKDDKQHIPDLIEMIIDPDDDVSRAAKAGLKSLTGQDFGPPAGSSAGQKALAASAWREWYGKQKK